MLFQMAELQGQTLRQRIVIKSREDRVKESITIILKMIEIGVSRTDPSFLEMKSRMDEWIDGGKSWTGKIKFPLVGRYAIIVLPERASTCATVEFKVRH